MAKLIQRSLGILAVLTVYTAYGQDPQFSQFYANPLYTNPAFAGTTQGIRFTTLARNQYTSLQNNYRTGSVSVDANLNSLNGGLGAFAMYDVAGDGFLTNNTFKVMYAYHTPLTRNLSFRAGIEAGIVQKTYDFSKFKFGDMIDDRLGFVKPTKEASGLNTRMFPNFSTGILLYTDQIYGGVAIHNLVEPNQSFYFPDAGKDEFKLPRRYTVHAGGIIYMTKQRRVDERIYLSPNVLYMQQRNFNQLNLGFYVKRNNLIIGGWFRQTSKNTDAVILLVGYKFNRLRVGYSFDATVSGARTATTGSHEISLATELRKPRTASGKRAPKAMKCPEF